jgi:hypothetical protein
MISRDNRRRGATTEQLRHDIDRGLTGDKIPALDPAAAPLGTDDEASGQGPTPSQVGDSRRIEALGRAPDTRMARGADTADRPTSASLMHVFATSSVLLMVAAILVVAVIAGALWFW